MKKGRRSTEQVIRILRESEGSSVEEACRRHGISQLTFQRYQKKYDGMDLRNAQRLRDLEKENGELKKLLAEPLLNRVLKKSRSSSPWS